MNRKLYFIIWSILRAGLLIGTFTDLPLSLRLFDRSNIVARRIDMFGMVPSMMLVGLSCCLFAWYNRNKRKQFILGIMATLLMGFLIVNEINSRFGLSIPVEIVLGALLARGSLAVFYVRKPDISEKQYLTAANIMVSALLVFLITSGIKTIWGRMRFYVMTDPASQFTAWYVIKPWGISDSMRSFPSGHSSFSVMLFYLSMLPELLNVKINRKRLSALAVLWTACVMVSRIIYGAHFLTDTCTGTLIGSACVYFGINSIYKNIKSKEL